MKLSDKSGGTWAIVGGYIRAASGSPVYGATSVTAADYTVKIYADDEGEKGAELTGADLATALANLKAKGGTYTVTATGSGGVRMSTTNPSGGFATAFGDNIDNKVTIGSLSFASGAAVVTPSAAWYSVSGNADNTIPTAGTSASEYTAPSAKIIIGLE